MSDEKQETVADIVAEIRRLNPETFLVSKWFNCPLPNRMRSYADRIEEAHKRECEVTRGKSSAVGNAAKMIEALKCIDNISKYLEGGAIRDVLHAYRNIQDRVRIAISTPPRNCDAFSKEKVLEILEDRSFSKEDTIEWLYAEAKGEMK